MEEQSKYEMRSSDEITLKELVQSSKMYFHEVLRKSWFIAILIIISCSYYAYKSFTHIPTYSAEIRYMVEAKNQSSSGLGGLLGNLGFSGGASRNQSSKIVEVSKSTRIINQVLFSKVLDGEYLANKLIMGQGYDQMWSKSNEEYENFRFTKDSIIKFSDLEKNAYNSLYKYVVGSENITPLLSSSYEGETGVFAISAKTKSESTTLALVQGVYDKTRFFFEDRVFEEQRNSRNLLKVKLDSIKREIDTKGLELAQFADNNQNLISRTSNYQKIKLQNEIQGLTYTYAEVMKNFEIADYNLASSKPFYLILDQSLPPLKGSRKPLLKNLVIGFIIGSLLGIICIILRKLFIDYMK